jgi:outer membrane receptor for ferrienterochelin and colicins
MKTNPLNGKNESGAGNGFDPFWRKIPVARLMLLAAPRAFRWIALIACRSCPAFMALNLFAADGPGTSVTNLADMSLEQLINVQVDSVYGASRYEQKVTQVPASVSIITADDIKKFDYRTLAEALRSVRGLYVPDDRNYAFLGIRGFQRPGDYNSRVLMLVDGHRLNENIYESVDLNHELDVDLIDRIEVIRGPSSSIYGSSAFFGVINLVTKRGAQFNGLEVSSDAGSFDTYKGRFSYGDTFTNGMALVLSGSYYTSAGQSELYYPEFDQRISTNALAANNGIARNADSEKAFNFFSSLGYKDLTLSGMYSYRNKQVPTASYQTVFNDGREETTDIRSYLDLKYVHEYSGDSQLEGRVFFDNYSYYGAYPYNYAAPGDPPDIVLNKDDTQGNWVGTEWQWTQRILDRHTLILGTEYREDVQNYQANYDDVIPRMYYVDIDRPGRILGLYAQAETALRTNLVLDTGLRYDGYFGSFGSTFNPRIGLIYNPWKGGTFKLLYGQAFRAPNAFERFYYPAQATLPELKPETIRTYELDYEQYLGSSYRLSVSAYYEDIRDLISQINVTNEAAAFSELAFSNIDRAKAVGGELELEARYASGFVAHASYALQRTTDEKGSELGNSPRHLAKLNLICPVYSDKLYADLELQYESAVKTLSGNQADGFAVANFTLFSQKLVKGLEMSASVYNLFDTHYSYPGAAEHSQDVIPQDGRSFQVKVTYRF